MSENDLKPDASPEEVEAHFKAMNPEATPAEVEAHRLAFFAPEAAPADIEAHMFSPDNPDATVGGGEDDEKGLMAR